MNFKRTPSQPQSNTQSCIRYLFEEYVSVFWAVLVLWAGKAAIDRKGLRLNLIFHMQTQVQPQFKIATCSHCLFRILDKKTSRFQFSVPGLQEIHRNLYKQCALTSASEGLKKLRSCLFLIRDNLTSNIPPFVSVKINKIKREKVGRHFKTREEF